MYCRILHCERVKMKCASLAVAGFCRSSAFAPYIKPIVIGVQCESFKFKFDYIYMQSTALPSRVLSERFTDN